LVTDIFCRVAEHFGQNYGEVIKFIASWPVYAKCHLPAVSLDASSVHTNSTHEHQPCQTPCLPSSCSSSASYSSSSSFSSSSSTIRIFVRKRPLLDFEEEANEWDVVSAPEHNTLTVHEGRVAPSGRRLALHLAHYTADAVVVDIKKLFREEFRALATHGGLTVLLYGQTGTGKTYTMKELAQLFFGSSPADSSYTYELQCFEVLHKGNTVFDLLDGRVKVKLLEDGNRVVHSKSKRVQVAGCEPQRALSVLEEALALRMSEATERNANSSRSHAFFIIKKYRKIPGGVEGGKNTTGEDGGADEGGAPARRRPPARGAGMGGGIFRH
jgi:hypothetical protein